MQENFKILSTGFAYLDSNDEEIAVIKGMGAVEVKSFPLANGLIRTQGYLGHVKVKMKDHYRPVKEERICGICGEVFLGVMRAKFCGRDCKYTHDLNMERGRRMARKEARV